MKISIDALKNKKRIILLAAFTVLFIIQLVLALVSDYMIRDLTDQQVADRWSDDMRMAQVSIFVTEDRLLEENDIERFKYELEKKLRDSGVRIPEEEEEEKDSKDKSGIIDTITIDEMNTIIVEQLMDIPERKGIKALYDVSYCAQGLVNLSFENREVKEASAIGFGGDFFLFHPLELVKGGYIPDTALMKDGIVIDEDMAWQLFGSEDVVGESVLIGGVPHFVIGVVKRDRGRIEESSGLSGSFVYMSYDSLSKYGEILSGKTNKEEISEDGRTAEKGGINTLEVVCPNPVSGLALTAAKESLGLDDRYVTAVDNTERFSVFALFDVIRSFGTRSMWSKAIFYPYWENIARGYEDILALMLLFRTICIVAIVVILVILVVDLYRHKRFTMSSVISIIADKKYDLEVKINRKKLGDNGDTSQ